MINSKKGITLIALVVTIIVLLILAGVVVASLTNEDKGIVDRTREARSSVEESQERDILRTIFLEMKNRDMTNPAEIQLYIENALTAEGVTDFVVDSSTVKIKSREYNFDEFDF